MKLEKGMQDLQLLKEGNVLGVDFKIYGDKENPLFLAKDVSVWIGHSNTSSMVSSVDENEKVIRNVYTLGGNQESLFLTEYGLYEVLMQSRKPIAKDFKKEIKNILKTIRKTGGYVASSEKFVESYFGSLDEATKKFMTITLDDKLRVERELKIANEKIEEQKPLVSFAETVAKSTDSIDIGQFAKVINDEGVKLGRNKMFQWLRNNKFLMKDNTPYQRYIDNGYFEVIEVVKETPYGSKLYLKTLIMPIAQIKILERLKEEFK